VGRAHLHHLAPEEGEEEAVSNGGPALGALPLIDLQSHQQEYCIGITPPLHTCGETEVVGRRRTGGEEQRSGGAGRRPKWREEDGHDGEGEDTRGGRHGERRRVPSDVAMAPRVPLPLTSVLDSPARWGP
jgi:hypothetical protein